MDLGEKLAKIILESKYSVALIASASWSHASLSSNSKNIIPDHDSDQKLLKSLLEGDYEYWRKLSRQTMENAGQHEILNWMPLMGAMSYLNKKPVLQDYVDTYLFQANKVFVYFE
jgi:predicted class III extradiol MEMO1 family dioxygenase